MTSIDVLFKSTRRQVRRLPALGPIFLVLYLACAAEPAAASGGLAEDVWWGRVPGGGIYQEMAIEFSPIEAGLAGVIHFLSDGKKVSELIMREIRLDGPKLRFKAGMFEFECEVDLGRNTIEGKSVGSGGPRMEFEAERRDPASIPGLLALPADYSYSQPAAEGDGLEVCDPDEAGIDPTTLEAIVKDIARGDGGVIHSLLIIQDGCLLLEEYFHGYGTDDLHAVASCTKSVTSLLVGLAIDQGFIPGTEASVLDYFPSYAAKAADKWPDMKLVHLLTMTAGLGWPPDPYRPATGGGARFAGNGPEGFQRLLERETAHDPGTKWDYANPEVNLLGGVIHSATGKHADSYAAENLFAPLGIEDFDWSSSGKVGGYPNMAGSLRLRPRDMAKIGVLVLQEGRWLSKQVITSDWIRTSCASHMQTGDPREEYGFLWWLMNLPNGKQIIAARGWGSQFILIDRDGGRVITVTGGNDTNNRFLDVLAVLAKHLYPDAY
jgi:CubicO group peptidase (beta-lactamase class C family)